MQSDTPLKGKTAKQLNFKPLALAVDLDKTLTYTPEGQDGVPNEHKLVYEMKAPTKSVLEQIHNAEVQFELSDTGGDKHQGHVKSGTVRKIFIVNCLVGWRNLFRETGKNADGEPLYELVAFAEPGNVGGNAHREIMMKNYEQIPERHVSGIVSVLRGASQTEDAVEGK